MIFRFFSSRLVVLKFFFMQNWAKLQKKLFVKSTRNCDFYFEVEMSTQKNQLFENHANSARRSDFFLAVGCAEIFFPKTRFFVFIKAVRTFLKQRISTCVCPRILCCWLLKLCSCVWTCTEEKRGKKWKTMHKSVGNGVLQELALKYVITCLLPLIF